MDEILEMLEEQAEQTIEETPEMTDEQIEENLYAPDTEEAEEINVLEEDGEEEEEQEEAQEEETAEDEPAHKARDEPSADELFAQQVRRAYGGMTEAMMEAQAQKMHEEDPEISVKAAKEIIKLRAQASGVVTAKPAAEDGHAKMLKEQAQEMASTKEGAALLKEMLTDETVKAKIDSGAWDVKQARAYYEGKRESEAGARKAPTTIKARGAVKSATKNVKNMSDAEFAKLEERMDELFESGKRPRL